MKKDKKNKLSKLVEFYGQDEFSEVLISTLEYGKIALDEYRHNLGCMLAEAVMLMEREELSGPDYQPKSPEIRKWASQQGSIFLGSEKVRVSRPRLRSSKGEISLKSYEALKNNKGFSEDLLQKVLAGLSARKYKETLLQTANSFGVSPSSISNRIIEITTKKLQEFRERSLANLDIVAVLLDSVYRGNSAFIVALGIDIKGKKHILGFWEGATENEALCQELFYDIESRGLSLSASILYITDGGKGMIKFLHKKFGKKLIHQRCTFHKDKNIQKHLSKQYRREAHQRFRHALNQVKYTDAKKELEEFKEWVSEINTSAATSLEEAFEEILTVHKLEIAPLLRKSLHTTNIIESCFSRVRDCENNIKNYQTSKMSQRWLGTVLLHCEKSFHRIEGYAHLENLRQKIEKWHNQVDEQK